MCAPVVVLLSGGLGQGVAGAVADPGEGLFAGQSSHSIHPVAHRSHRGDLRAAAVQQQVGRPGETRGRKQCYFACKFFFVFFF